MRSIGTKKPLAWVDPNIIDYAKRVCERSDSNFVRTFRFMTRSQREAMTLFYAFCREVDDWADEEELGSPESRRAVLVAMKEELLGGLSIASTSHWESIVGVSALLKRYPLTPKPFVDLIDGVLMDCHFRAYRLWDDVLQYCYNVASTVGLVSVAIFSPRPETLWRYAIHQGLALQLVNIYRDFEDDWRRGRCYIPSEWSKLSHQEFQEALKSASSQTELRSELMVLRERVRFEAIHQFDLALENCPLWQRPFVWPLLILGISYMNLLDQIPVGSFDVPSIRPVDAIKDRWRQVLNL